METRFSVLRFCVLLVVLIFSNFSSSYELFDLLDDPALKDHTYTRFPEIENHCSSFLSSAYELDPDDSRGHRLKAELTVSKGDWSQELGGHPLLPFDDSDIPKGTSSPKIPLKLVYFDVGHVNPVHQSRNTVGVKGSMSIEVSRNGSCPIDLNSKFHAQPGCSRLTIVFEGVYAETNENGGQRLLCLLGNTTLPSQKFINDPFRLAEIHRSNSGQSPHLLQDDQILLVLRYPQTFNLTKRVITGEMMSLNEPGSSKYFDKVYVYSQLTSDSKYQFSSKLFESVSCDPNPLQDEMDEDGVNTLDGIEFCRILQQVSHGGFEVMPYYKFHDRFAYSDKVGPFLLSKEIKTSDSSYDDIRLIWTHVKCEEEMSQVNRSNAKISVVIRAVHSSLDTSVVESRTGLSSMTLVSEGTWKASDGKLCMMGCLGEIDSFESCNWKISLYFPQVFSVHQRNIVIGSISSVINESDSFSPLLFSKVERPANLGYNYIYYRNGNYIDYAASYLSYKFSKIELADAFKKRSQRIKVLSTLKKSLLSYPALGDNREQLVELENLGYSLGFNAYAFPDQLFNENGSRVFIMAEVLSVGSLFGRRSSWIYEDNPSNALVGIETNKLAKDQLLNVSMQLMFTKASLDFKETYYRNLSTMFVEGIYDPVVGEMHLIGCRKIMAVGADTERGLDCLIEVMVHYPSRSTRWFRNPIVKITITSQRNKDDPLHFSPLNLKTLMIFYEDQTKDVAFRKIFEGAFRIIMLSGAIAIVLNQLFHRKEDGEKDATPYIYLLMLSFQILGYCYILIDGTHILFKFNESITISKRPFDMREYWVLLKFMEYIGRLLVLTALLFTIRLFQKVSESQDRRRHYRLSKMKHLSSEKTVLGITLAIHIIGILFLFIVGGTVIEDECMGLVQDWFLLPQVIENFLCKIQVQPLKKTYYIGFTLLRISLHLYEHIRDPVLDPYSDEAQAIIPNLNLSSVLWNILVLLVMIILAITIHVQQRRRVKASDSQIHIE